MVRCCDIEDYYKDGLFLRRWELVAGYPRCTVDALPVASLDPGDVSDQEVANAIVRGALEDLEAYETALRLSALDEPQRLVIQYDQNQNAVEVTNPVWTNWEASRQAVLAVSSEVVALYQMRQAG